MTARPTRRRQGGQQRPRTNVCAKPSTTYPAGRAIRTSAAPSARSRSRPSDSPTRILLDAGTRTRRSARTRRRGMPPRC
jgi:hypothetical protein